MDLVTWMDFPKRSRNTSPSNNAIDTLSLFLLISDGPASGSLHHMVRYQFGYYYCFSGRDKLILVKVWSPVQYGIQ